QSRLIEHALFNAALPYRVYGGMRFFERAEVKSALAYLRLLASPDDDGAFLRVANFPPRGIGARTLEHLTDAARVRGTSLWQAAEGRAAMQLMTVHSAKGLEFHTVFVTGLEEGLFPHEQSLNEFDGVEEERRLMYVAVTRAKRRLYVTHAQSRMLHGQVRYNIASRFLDEPPGGLVQWLSPHRRRASSAIDIDPAEW